MYTLRSIARRGVLFGAVAALVAATVAPSAAVFADSLNPLTERSLLLSSSAPGFMNTDGSGNSTDDPNAIGENYAPAGSGPNGTKTGETFSFRVSTDSAAASRPIKAFTLQYCTTAAGLCQAPGDNGDLNEVAGVKGDARDGVYDAATNTTGRMTNAQAHPQGKSDLDVVFDGDGANLVGGTDYKILVNGDEIDNYTNWVVATSNEEDDAYIGALTGKHNFITLSNTSSTIAPASQDKIELVFNASETNYITNPGSGSFFVKINTYDSALTTDHVPAVPADENTHIIDGGVTVANVMTDSIHITTKVLETMQFSVGTENRDTWVVNCPVDPQNPECAGDGAVHGTCDPIQTVNGNRLNLGNPNAEFSLSTDTAYDVYSYWRLSSNSSGGATVYYSGNTLANTVGDEIAPIGGTEQLSTPGTEQFGLGFVDATTDDTGDFDPAFETLVTDQPDRYKMPTLKLADGTPDVYLQPNANYDEADGNINDPDGDQGSETIEAKFAFKKSSNTIPEVIAQNNSMVISCATAKMRYVANIAADTPAGVYTTKINYLAAPQY